jgi:uncharacterized protein (DUF58 family)
MRLPDEIYALEESVLEFFASKGPSLVRGHSLTFSIRGGGEPDIHQPYLELLGKGERKRLQGLFRFHRRGVFTLTGATVTCNWPFGIISKTRVFKQDRRVTIYPAIFAIEEILKSGGEGMFAADSSIRGLTGGLLNVRQFIPGDDYRHLHWKATAKTGELMIKEFAREKGRMFWVHFNPQRHFSATTGDKELFEAGVSVAASLAYHGRSDGLKMIFSAPGLRLAPEVNSDHFKNFLDYLAEVKPARGLKSDRPASLTGRRRDEFVIVVDPLNDDVDWGPGTIVLDKRYALDLMEVRK